MGAGGLGGANKPWICAQQLFRTLRLRPVAVAGAEAGGPQPNTANDPRRIWHKTHNKEEAQRGGERGECG